jgi:phosphate transport system substrate-binding protein
VQQANGKIAYPTQEALGTNDYPLARVLYIINCQGYEGLGIGFASFIAGDKGQRIVLKSGIAPIREPGRKIVTRKQIEKTKI